MQCLAVITIVKNGCHHIPDLLSLWAVALDKSTN